MDWKDGLILGAIAVGVLTYDTARSYKALNVDISGYRVYDVNFSKNSALLRVDLRITNPLLLGLTLYSLRGVISIDGINVATIDQTYNYYIRGKRTHIIPIIAECNILNVSQVIMRLLSGVNTEDMYLTFNGELSVGRRGVVALPVNAGIVMSDFGV